MTFMEKTLYYIEFQINKHGQYSGMQTAEEVVDSLSNYELLRLIADAIDNPPKEK